MGLVLKMGYKDFLEISRSRDVDSIKHRPVVYRDIACISYRFHRDMGRSDVVSYPRGSVQAVRSHGCHDRQPGLHPKLAPPAVLHLSAGHTEKARLRLCDHSRRRSSERGPNIKAAFRQAG